jgi:hypothetical protein
METPLSSRIGYGSSVALVQDLRVEFLENIAPELKLQEFSVGTSASVLMLEFVPVLYKLQETKNVNYPTYIRLKDDWGTYLGSKHPGGVLPNWFTEGVGREIRVDLQKLDWEKALQDTMMKLPTDTKVLCAVIEPLSWLTLTPRCEQKLSKLLHFCTVHKIPVILDVCLVGFCTGPGYLGIPPNSCLSKCDFLVCSKNIGGSAIFSTKHGRKKYRETFDKVMKRHGAILTVHMDSSIVSSILLVGLYHVHSNFEKRVELVNDAVPRLLEKYGFGKPDHGRGFLWKFSAKQLKLLKNRGDFVSAVLDESGRLRLHPDMDVDEVERRIIIWNNRYPAKSTQLRTGSKRSKTSKNSESSSTAADAANNTPALQASIEDDVDGDDDSDEIEELPAEDKKKLSPAIKEGCKRFDAYWKKCSQIPVVSGPDAYGEPTAGTTARIWDATHRLIGIKSTDIVVDIGAGTGKLLHSSKFFCLTGDVKLMGIESHLPIFQESQRILTDYPLPNADLQFGDAAEVKDWGPATIGYRYDGGPGVDLNKKHETITLAFLKTPSARALFSTKLNETWFLQYTSQDRAIRKNWVLFKLKALKFGKSTHQVGSCYHCCL